MPVPRGASSSRTSGEQRRFTLAVLAKEVLREAAVALAARGVAVMPLKGVLFQLLLYPDPAERLLSDVDLLVRGRDFAAAIDALIGAGFEPRGAGRSLIEVQLRSPKGLAVDLHRRLFSPGRYDLATEAVFERATRDERLLGVPLHIADPHDTAAHLVGKFVSDHVTAEAPARLEELARWVAHCRIEPVQLARHLAACGLARAARYTLGRGAALSADGFFSEALEALPRDPLGAAYARCASVLIPRLDGTVLAPGPAHLLNATLLRAAASLTLTTVNRWRHARMERDPRAAKGVWAPFFSHPSNDSFGVNVALGRVPPAAVDRT